MTRERFYALNKERRMARDAGPCWEYEFRYLTRTCWKYVANIKGIPPREWGRFVEGKMRVEAP
jgi:hypothetical protein